MEGGRRGRKEGEKKVGKREREKERALRPGHKA